MKVQMVDIRAQHRAIDAELKAAIASVIDSGAYIMGPEVAKLEAKLCEYVGVRHSIGVSSGTDALLLPLHALKLGPGDLVLTTTYSFFATAGAAARLGATPIFLDIDPDSYNIDTKALAGWFGDNRSRIDRVKAIIPVHLFGQCADMAPILALAREHRIPILEDAAQAIGATYPLEGKTRSAGTMGTFGAFSFFPSKNLGCLGDGGFVSTNDDELAETMRCLRTNGAKPKYYHSMIGGNFRLDTIQAAVLLVKLPHLSRWHGMRRERAGIYDARLGDIAEIKTPHCAYGREHHIYNQYVIEVREGGAAERDRLAAHLQSDGIATSIFYPVPFHLQKCFADLGYRAGDLPLSERAATHSLALPIYPELPGELQDHVIESIRRFFS
jgi:dTDP-4-amino-4,6-dideoxygalactose transaminase